MRTNPSFYSQICHNVKMFFNSPKKPVEINNDTKPKNERDKMLGHLNLHIYQDFHGKIFYYSRWVVLNKNKFKEYSQYDSNDIMTVLETLFNKIEEDSKTNKNSKFYARSTTRIFKSENP